MELPIATPDADQAGLFDDPIERIAMLAAFWFEAACLPTEARAA